MKSIVLKDNLRTIDEYFINLSEPTKSCFEFLRTFILEKSPYIKEEWKFKLPFYYYKGKMFCYLWKNKKENRCYISFNKGSYLKNSNLLSKGRKIFKILVLKPNKDLPIKTINDILDELIVVLESKN